MASLENTRIQDTYEGLLKTNDNSSVSGEVEITDGAGNRTGVHISNNGDLKADNDVTVGGDIIISGGGKIFGDGEVTAEQRNSFGFNTTNDEFEVDFDAGGHRMLLLDSTNSTFSIGDVDTSRSGTRMYNNGSRYTFDSNYSTMLSLNASNLAQNYIQLGGTGTANRLDDYEEGTFNPTFTSGTGGTLTVGSYNLQNGFYTKIGQQVTVTIRIAGDTITKTGSANLQVSGLPFTIASAVEAKLGGNISGGSDITNLAKVNAIDKGNNNTSVIFLYNSGAAANDAFINLNINDINSEFPVIKLTLTYFTTQ